jgi:hypothetical protein
LDLIVPQIEFLQTCVVMEGRAEGLQTGITQPYVVPFKAEFLNRIIFLQQLSEITCSALSNVISLEVKFGNVVV